MRMNTTSDTIPSSKQEPLHKTQLQFHIDQDVLFGNDAGLISLVRSYSDTKGYTKDNSETLRYVVERWAYLQDRYTIHRKPARQRYRSHVLAPCPLPGTSHGYTCRGSRNRIDFVFPE